MAPPTSPPRTPPRAHHPPTAGLPLSHHAAMPAAGPTATAAAAAGAGASAPVLATPPRSSAAPLPHMYPQRPRAPHRAGPAPSSPTSPSRASGSGHGGTDDDLRAVAAVAKADAAECRTLRDFLVHLLAHRGTMSVADFFQELINHQTLYGITLLDDDALDIYLDIAQANDLLEDVLNARQLLETMDLMQHAYKLHQSHSQSSLLLDLSFRSNKSTLSTDSNDDSADLSGDRVILGDHTDDALGGDDDDDGHLGLHFNLDQLLGDDNMARDPQQQHDGADIADAPLQRPPSRSVSPRGGARKASRPASLISTTSTLSHGSSSGRATIVPTSPTSVGGSSESFPPSDTPTPVPSVADHDDDWATQPIHADDNDTEQMSATKGPSPSRIPRPTVPTALRSATAPGALFPSQLPTPRASPFMVTATTITADPTTTPRRSARAIPPPATSTGPSFLDEDVGDHDHDDPLRTPRRRPTHRRRHSDADKSTPTAARSTSAAPATSTDTVPPTTPGTPSRRAQVRRSAYGSFPAAPHDDAADRDAYVLECEQKIVDLRHQLTQLRDELAASKRQAQELHQHEAHIVRQMEDLQGKLYALQAALEVAQGKAQRATARLAHEKLVAASLRTELASVTAQLADAKRSLEDRDRDWMVAQQQVDQYRDAFERAAAAAATPVGTDTPLSVELENADGRAADPAGALTLGAELLSALAAAVPPGSAPPSVAGSGAESPAVSRAASEPVPVAVVGAPDLSPTDWVLTYERLLANFERLSAKHAVVQEKLAKALALGAKDGEKSLGDAPGDTIEVVASNTADCLTDDEPQAGDLVPVLQVTAEPADVVELAPVARASPRITTTSFGVQVALAPHMPASAVTASRGVQAAIAPRPQATVGVQSDPIRIEHIGTDPVPPAVDDASNDQDAVVARSLAAVEDVDTAPVPTAPLPTIAPIELKSMITSTVNVQPTFPSTADTAIQTQIEPVDEDLDLTPAATPIPSRTSSPAPAPARASAPGKRVILAYHSYTDPPKSARALPLPPWWMWLVSLAIALAAVLAAGRLLATSPAARSIRGPGPVVCQWPAPKAAREAGWVSDVAMPATAAGDESLSGGAATAYCVPQLVVVDVDDGDAGAVPWPF
ncbi:hypothetical protein GGF31_007427 [Allomyces arbusculus]|nr:hypothetical protein GGF31_007427 [Allomyces arbusculus]